MVTISFTDDEALQVRKALSARLDYFESYWAGHGETSYTIHYEHSETEIAWIKVARAIRELGGT